MRGKGKQAASNFPRLDCHVARDDRDRHARGKRDRLASAIVNRNDQSSNRLGLFVNDHLVKHNCEPS